ncbi:FGGY-family carbohydrate kinase [Paraflavitalea sp. CAU 1676]|uniref:FGGY-family carbohydrate kinase n=1 Tax=Paraflavitalea sp. CAU 1676 TaxID=3032598 RepID=UPI0023DB5334|nr:FGGY-family carbohydrate kinase [Paraflavitalea sp. CAU 1676]MDF2191152.1 FGGY-family carbohydrate kinase [Paraflavitalea sp. CAU 1676]
MEPTYFIGIDIGTQGARVVLLDDAGNQLGAREEAFVLDSRSREEQDPQQWYTSCLRSLKSMLMQLPESVDRTRIKAIGVTSTSGTIIPIDKEGYPLHAAIMYSDSRSAQEAALCRTIALNSGTQGYTAYNASSGLPKMIWWLNNYPAKKSKLARFIHAADFITGRLSGNFSVTDYTNALKSGFDLHTKQWPAYIVSELPIEPQWLQNVVPSGEVIGVLKSDLAAQLNLPKEVLITAGITDGCASQVASGAMQPGDWNTTIGTTLVIKGVTKKEIIDPAGAIYCHRHPQGYWMPGGASNTGADWVSRLFAGGNLEALNEAAARKIPGKYFAWPLLQQGERFPFVAPQAIGFAPENISREELFLISMEGVAYIERYAYERIKKLSGETITQVSSAGGGSNSDTWLSIRSNVLNLPMRKMQNVTGAAGAAVLAASKTHFSNITTAACAMIRPEKTIKPHAPLAARYEKNYHTFVELLKQKGYITH